MATELSETIAAVDMGSNSFHLLVGRHDGGRLVVIDRLKERVALAEGLGKDLMLDEAAQERGFACLRLFAEVIGGVEKGAFRAVATSTLRRARNAQEFIVKAEEILGHSVDVIPGIEEARLVFVGAISEMPSVARRLVVDIGGGSTELALGETEAEHTASLHMGCVNFTQGFFEGGGLTADRFSAAAFAARLELEPVARALSDESWEEAIGSSGTARALEQLIRENGWGDDGITLKGLKSIRDAFVKAGSVDALSLAGLSDRRRPVIAGGLGIMLGVFEALGVERMTTTEGALREGVAFELIGDERTVGARKATVERLSTRYALDAEHARRVRQTSLALFDQVAEEWALGAPSRRILDTAASLHEVGLAVRFAGYHKHGAYILDHSDLPGFTTDEQRMLAALVLCHRRKFRHESLDEVGGELGGSAKKVALLLRLAVRLNRKRSDDVPESALSVKKRKLKLTLPKDWLQTNPLSAAGLDRERDRLDRAGFTLTLED